MEVSTPKMEGKLHHARSFPSDFGEDTSINPKNITTFPYHFINDYANERVGKVTMADGEKLYQNSGSIPRNACVACETALRV